MKHYDYVFDIEYGYHIILDDELTLEKIWFEEGDILQVCKTPSGKVMLRKVDPVTKFTLGFPRFDDEDK
jgi:hypothetical protein